MHTFWTDLIPSQSSWYCYDIMKKLATVLSNSIRQARGQLCSILLPLPFARLRVSLQSCSPDETGAYFRGEVAIHG